jgi:choline dehydrogenase
VPEDYDEWAALGNDDWSWERVLPYFRRLENDLDFDDDYHGRNGPVPIRRYREDELTPVQTAFVTAMRALGYPETPDNNAPQSSGMGPHPMNKRGRTRMSVAICYIEPARHRLNLTIRGDCLIRRVLFDGGRASGVEVETAGVTQTVHAERIVLAAGAIASPAILMRSGIGPEAHLREVGIDVLVDLPGVGANLDDHPMLGTTFLAREGMLNADDPLVQTTYRYTSTGGDERNDMQLMPVSQLPTGDGRMVYTIGSVIERQKSIGALTLTSADPREQPRIEQRFLEHPDDVRRLVEGVRMAERVGAHDAFAKLNAGLLSPGPDVLRDDGTLAEWCKRVAASGFHPSCTAKMAPAGDKMGVVDQRLRVRGFDNLYVADASVMPRCPRANIHLTSIMIGERMGEWLRER